MLEAIILTLAVSLLCPSPNGQFSQSIVTDNYVVCMVDVPNQSSYALWSVPIGGGPAVRLSQEMETNRDVIAFQVSADRVAYTADPNVWTQYELYSVPISGGSPVKLSGAMPSDNDVDDFAFADDGWRVVYRKGRNATGVWDLWSTGVTGGGTVRLSQPNMSAVQRGFQVRGDLVRFAQDPSGSGVASWYVTPIGGGAIQQEVFSNGFETGNTGAWR